MFWLDRTLPIMISAVFGAFIYSIVVEKSPTHEVWQPQEGNLLITNKNRNLKTIKEIGRYPILRGVNIIDASFMLYTQDFAQKYGMPTDRIYDLPNGTHAMEIQVHNRRSTYTCRLNVLFEQGLGLDFPNEELSIPNRGFKMLPRVKGFRRQKVETSLRLHIHKKMLRYSHNFALATTNYHNQGTKSKGAGESITLVDFSKQYYQGFDYVSLRIPCGFHNILQKHNVRLWVKKKSGRDFPNMVFAGIPHQNDFASYIIPLPIINHMLPIIQQTTSFERLLPISNIKKREK